MENDRVAEVLAGRRILLVEDEYYLADDMRRVLLKAGAEVIGPAPTREKALELLASAERVDFAVLDINLRGETVHQVADALGVRGVPFLFATGYDRSAVPERFRHIPCWQKPFNATALAQALPSIETEPKRRTGPKA